MIYKRFYLVILVYLAGIILMASLFAFSVGRDLTYSILSLIIMILLTVSFGVWLNRTNKKLAFFFSAVRNDESSLFFSEETGFANEKLLNSLANPVSSEKNKA